MLENQWYAGNSTDDDLFPAKRKTGVLHKTKKAFGKVNSKLKNNSSKPVSMGQMMLFESDSSLNFNMDDVEENVVKPFSEMAMKTQEKEEEDSGTRATEMESYSDHKERVNELDDYHDEEDAKVSSSPGRHGTLVSPRKRVSSRNISRNSRGRKSGNPPQKASSTGDIHLHGASSSRRASSARVKRHQPVVDKSPGALGSHHTTPTQLSKKLVLKDLPETPLTDATDMRQETPETTENSLRRVSRAFEDDAGAMGGYFSKLVEKMEGEDAKERANEKDIEGIDNEEAKKGSKFKTPKGFKKLFSLHRDKTQRQESTGNSEPVKAESQESDLAMFTAFISSPKALNSPQRSERKKRSTITPADDDYEPDMDFPEIPSEKQTSLDDIRKEVCWKRELPGNSSPAGAESPRTRDRKLDYDPPKEPASPGSRRQRRVKNNDAEDRPSKISDDSIPRHSVSTRRNRVLRTSETDPNDKEQSPDKSLSRSSNRSRRSRGIPSRGASDHSSTKMSTLSTEIGDFGIEEKEIQESKHLAEEKKDKRPSEFRLSRSSRGSSRRILSNPSSESGSAPPSRRKRSSASRRADQASASNKAVNKDSGGRQLRQFGRSTSVSQLHNKTQPHEREFQSLCKERGYGMNNLFSVNELGASEAEEALCDEGVDASGFSSIRENESPKDDERKKVPSLAESLERGSDLNRQLFDHDGQETVLTDDGSCWLDQCSVSGLNIRSSASVVAPQLSFDPSMTKIVEHAPSNL